MLKPLWEPSAQRIKNSNMYRFMQSVNDIHGTTFTDYNELYQWSVENLEAFWAEIWRFAEIKASKKYREVIDEPTRMPGAHWFTGSRLNFAENLLRFRDEKTAIIFRGEDASAGALPTKNCSRQRPRLRPLFGRQESAPETG